jgi:hypothetical protein
VIRVAQLVLDNATEHGTHPVALATHWIMAGCSFDTSQGRIREGAPSPWVM